MTLFRTLALLALAALAACSSISGGKPLPLPQGEFTPLNPGRMEGENALVATPTPGRSTGG